MARDDAYFLNRPPHFDAFVALLDMPADSEAARVVSDELHLLLEQRENATVPRQFFDPSALRRLIALITECPSEDLTRAAADVARAISEAGAEHRMRLVEFGLADALAALFTNDTARSWQSAPTLCAIAALLGQLLWRTEQGVSHSTVESALAVCQHLLTVSDCEVQRAACAALARITDGAPSRVAACDRLDMLPSIVELLKSRRPSLIGRALLVCGNFCECEDPRFTQRVLDANILSAIVHFLLPEGSDEYAQVRKDSCWVLSNIAASPDPQHAQAVTTCGAISHMGNCLLNDPCPGVRREAMWVLANVVDKMPRDFVFDPCIPTAVCAFLQSDFDSNTEGWSRHILVALEFCINIVEPQFDPQFRQALLDAGIVALVASISQRYPELQETADEAIEALTQ